VSVVIVGGIDAAASFAAGLLAQPANSAATRAMLNTAIDRFVISASSCETDRCERDRARQDLTASWFRDGVRVLIERHEAGGEGASNADVDEVLLAGAGDTHDAIERVNSRRDALEHEQR
jgi:hypothetical protein